MIVCLYVLMGILVGWLCNDVIVILVIGKI